jgi:excisionase family DNA binding protein
VIAQSDERTRELIEGGLLTVQDAARFLSVSRSKLYELMDCGELKFVKLGRSRRIPRRALVELAASHVQGGWRQ